MSPQKQGIPRKNYVQIGRAHPAMRTADADAMQTKIVKALAKKEHLWIAMAAFTLSDDVLRKLDTESPYLDQENLLTIEVGCFNCEFAFTRGLIGTVCAGAPGR